MNNALSGPLKVHQSNPRYFADGTGKAVYFSGPHTWFVLQDGTEGPFDYEGYLDFMKKNGFNFMRFWCQEGAKDYEGSSRQPVFYEPSPFERTGPGLALDGKPKYDLTRFSREYFDRLRSRVIQAGEYGIYAAVMLFQGWGIERKESSRNPWAGHAFNISNNINGIDGDPRKTGEGRLLNTLESPEIVSLQKAYINKVIDALNDLDNVLIEIANESGNYAGEWQYEMVRHIKAYEKSKPKQHPVFMTYFFPDGNNHVLYNSQAQAVSPGGFGIDNEWNLNPPSSDGRKVIIADTDHFGGSTWGCSSWVWKCFTRGLHPILMDDMKYAEWRTPVYEAMSDTLKYARKIDLGGMLPSGYMTSTGYCLAKPGSEILVYQPEVAPFVVKLIGMNGIYDVEWFDPGKREVIQGKPVNGGDALFFSPPFRGDAVLYLKKQEGI